MKKSGGFIPGIRPGKPTSDYLDGILEYIILIGACGTYRHCLPGSDHCLWTVLSEPSLLWRYFSYHYRRCST